MKYNLFTYSIVILATLIFATYILTGGLMITHDSFQYIGCSYYFFNDLVLNFKPNQPLLAFPPLYPIILSVGHFFNNPMKGFEFLHIIIFAINSILVVKFFTKHINNNFIQIGAISFTILSSFFIVNHVFIWSEAFFYTLSFLWFNQTLKIQENETFKNSFFYILIGLLLCMQRKTGFILILSSAIFFIIQQKNWSFKQIGYITILSILASSFTFYWRIKSTLISENFMYDKHFSFTQTWKAINEEITELGTWLIPRIAPEWLKWIVIILLIAFLFKQLSKVKLDESIQLSILLLLIYSGVIISFMTFYKLSQTMDIRVMGSIAPFIILIVAKAVENYKNTNQSKYQNIILICIFSIVMCYNLARSYSILEQWKNVKKLNLKEILAKN